MSKLKYGVYNGRTIKRILDNSRLYFLTAFFIIGIIIGAVSIKSDSGGVTDSLRQVVESYTKLRAEQGIAANFCNSFAINALFSAAVIFLGFSLIGYPFIMLTPIVKGMGIGMVSGYMYSVYKFIGLGYSLLIIYPGAVISVFAFILACSHSCEYSRNAYAKAIQGRGQFEKDETKLFAVRQLIMLGVAAAGSLVDALFAAMFSGFFEL